MSDAKKVLVVEDEQILLKTIQFTLKDAGYEVLVAMDGEEASSAIAEHRPDIVLLDILLPKKNGMDVLREMRANESTKNIPVLLLTNLSDQESISDGVALGAQGYFVKSDMTLDEIAAKVAETLSE